MISQKASLRTLKQTFTSRQVLNVLLVGDPKVGKSSIVRNFRGYGDDDQHSTSTQNNRQDSSLIESSAPRCNMVEVEFTNGARKKVIFTELQTRDVPSVENPANDTSNPASAPRPGMGGSGPKQYPAPPIAAADLRYDLVCICYEEPTYLKRIMEEKYAFFAYPVPKIALKCRQDGRAPEPVVGDALKDFEEYGLTMFSECSIKNNDFTTFSNDLLRVLENPYV